VGKPPVAPDTTNGENTLKGRYAMIIANCIGAGRWGPNMVRAFANLPDARIHYVCDLDEQRLGLIRSRMKGVETTTDIDLALNDPDADAILVATPVHTHYALTFRALVSGKHVLVEKPLCRSVQQGEELTALADSKGLILAVGHVFLFNDVIRKIGEYITDGELGRIQHIHAVRTNLGPVRDDVNALWDLAAHDLSIFNYWLRSTPTSVSTIGQRSLGNDVEDVVVANWLYPGDVLACTYVSWLNPRKVREITVVGDKKMAVWNDLDITAPVRLYDKSIDINAKNGYSDSFGSFQALIRDGDVVIPRVASREPLQTECAHFVECIREGIRPVNDADSALAVVRALTAADVSMNEEGAAVAVEGERAEWREPELLQMAEA
jgi:predicted dehydrogenase